MLVSDAVDAEVPVVSSHDDVDVSVTGVQVTSLLSTLKDLQDLLSMATMAGAKDTGTEEYIEKVGHCVPVPCTLYSNTVEKYHLSWQQR